VSDLAGAAPALQEPVRATGAVLTVREEVDRMRYLRALGETVGSALIPALILVAPLALLANKKHRKPIQAVVVGVRRGEEVEYEDEEGEEGEYVVSSRELAENLVARLLGLM